MKPIAQIFVVESEGFVPLPVQFNSYSTDEDGYIDSYFWDFGDGAESENKNPFHVYEKPGQYTVILKVVDNAGEQNSSRLLITVNENQSLTIKAIAIPNYGFSPMLVKFVSEVSGGNQPFSYHWTFTGVFIGESIEQNPKRLFLSPGVWSARLTVTDSIGFSKTTTINIWVDKLSVYIHQNIVS